MDSTITQMNIYSKDGSVKRFFTNKIDSITFTQCPAKVNYEGKIYNTVIIGTQCWLKENLDVGTMINGNQDQTNDGAIEKYCYNNEPDKCSTYGGLYQWDEAMQYSKKEGTRGICPKGWHVPTLSEFQELREAVNGDGNILQQAGFSALNTGYFYPPGNFFDHLGYDTNFWSSTQIDEQGANNMRLYQNQINFLGTLKIDGFPIRCIKN